MDENTTNKPDSIAWTIIGAVLLAQLFFALTLAIFPGWPKVGEWLNSDKAANWAQAFMAFIAILAGAGAIAWQVRRQAELEESRRRVDEIRRLRALYYGVGMLRQDLSEMLQGTLQGESYTLWLSSVESSAERLRQVPLMEIPTVAAIDAIATCLSAVSHLPDRIKNASSRYDQSLIPDFTVKTIDLTCELVTKCELELASQLNAHYDHLATVGSK